MNNAVIYSDIIPLVDIFKMKTRINRRSSIFEWCNINVPSGYTPFKTGTLKFKE